MRDPGVLSQPWREGFCRSLQKQINWAMGREIADQGARGLATAQGSDSSPPLGQIVRMTLGPALDAPAGLLTWGPRCSVTCRFCRHTQVAFNFSDLLDLKAREGKRNVRQENHPVPLETRGFLMSIYEWRVEPARKWRMIRFGRPSEVKSQLFAHSNWTGLT